MIDIMIPAHFDLRDYPDLTTDRASEIIKNAYEANIRVKMIVITRAQMAAWGQATAAKGRANLARALQAGETDEDIINLHKLDAEIGETLAAKAIPDFIDLIVTSYGETKVSLQAYPDEVIR